MLPRAVNPVLSGKQLVRAERFADGGLKSQTVDVYAASNDLSDVDTAPP